MTPKFLAASKLAVLLAASALAGLMTVSASAQSTQQPQPKPKRPQPVQQQYDRDGRPYYGNRGPNQVYQQGPHTRVYVTTRSWLDAGTEVLPGDRKFQDYAFPPELGYPSFARENNNRPIDRQPTNPPSDMGGYSRSYPLY
jgi:hypothetical protein